MRFFLPLLALTVSALAIDDYVLGPESQPQEGVPKGEVRKETFDKSTIYPGTVRDYWVYIPKQYDAAKPANLMVFFDGGGFAKVDGGFRVPVVFDNLIAKNEIPVTIAVMVNPGVVKSTQEGQRDRSNRSFEYDSLGDAHAHVAAGIPACRCTRHPCRVIYRPDPSLLLSGGRHRHPLPAPDLI